MRPEFVERLLDETRDEINRADTKASILLAGAGVLIAGFTATLLNDGVTFRRAPGLVQIFGVISAALLGAGVFCLGAAVLPRIGMAIEGRARYFMDHAQYTDLDHLRRSVEREASDPAGRHLEQLSALSGVVKTKYRLTQAGEILIGLALVSVMSTGLLNYLMS